MATACYASIGGNSERHAGGINMNKCILKAVLGLSLAQFAILGYSQPPSGLPENSKVELSGTLQVFIRENLKAETSEYEYFLERGQGKSPVKLIFQGTHPKQLRSGVGIAVRGTARRGAVEVTAANIEEGADSSGSASSSAEAATLDSRSVLVVVVNLSDVVHSGTQVASMNDYYFGASSSMSDMYEKITFGQLMISGQVVGPISVTQNATDVCADPFRYASAWLSQAETEFGISRSDFRHRIFAVPKSMPGCGWTGYANVGCGSACNAFNRWSDDVNTTSHEFGHNLNLGHAGVGTNQYADYSSFMGYSLSNGVRALDGAHHWQTGWDQNINAQSVQTIQSSETYEVAPLMEVTPSASAPSIYRIDVATGDPYFLSARVSQGYDTDLASLNSAALAGVNIHRYAGAGYGQTDRVAQLTNGESYTDTQNSLTISQLSRAEDGTVTFSVDLGEGECVESAPGLSINPSFKTVGPAESYDFPVTLVNNDSTSCAPRQFNLATTHGSLSPGSFTVTPGAQESSALTITGDMSGETVATVSVLGEATTPVTAILTIDSTPPSVQNLSGVYERKGKNHRVQLSWTGSDDSGIGSYAIVRDGVSIATTDQSSYTDSLPRSPDASYTYQVRAFDIHGNTGESGSVTVSTSGGTDGADGGGGGNDKPCRGKKCSS